MKIGILALQGGYEAHAQTLSRLELPWQYVRSVAELSDIHGLILPGGESSTALNLLEQSGLFQALKQCGELGMPFFGTCAGAILLAKEVVSPAQPSLGLIDVTIERNAYGRQLASRIVHGRTSLKPDPLEMFFIRAPRFSHIAPHVEILAHYENEPVCVQQNNVILANFHPELTRDTTLHQHFINLIAKQ